MKKTIAWLETLWFGLGVLLLILALLWGGLSLWIAVGSRWARPAIALRVIKEPPQSSRAWTHADWEKFFSIPYRWQSYVYWKMSPFEGHHITINSEGERETWNPPETSTKPIRVLLFGGSSLWGMGVLDDATIPSKLSQLLNLQSHRSVQVVNLAQPSYENTREFLTFLLLSQQKDNPTVLVFYDGFGEVLSAIRNQEAGVSALEDAREKMFGILPSGVERSWMKKIEDNTATLQEPLDYKILTPFRFHLENVRLPPEAASERLASEVLQTYLFNIRLVRELSSREHIPSYFYWEPLILFKQHRTPAEEAWKQRLQEPDFFRRVYEQVEGSKALTGLTGFHNLSHLFDQDPEARYLDDCNLTERGNERIAHKMAADLLPYVISSP